MSELKKFAEIYEEDFKKKGISELSDRPNQPSTFGVGGLTAAELKARFDNLPQIIRGKLNEIYTALSGVNATQYIALPYKLEWQEKYGGNLYDFLLAFASGDISEDLVVKTNEKNLSLSAIINNLFSADSQNAEDIKRIDDSIEELRLAINGKQEKLIAGEGIVIQGNVISAPGQSDVAGTIVFVGNSFSNLLSF